MPDMRRILSPESFPRPLHSTVEKSADIESTDHRSHPVGFYIKVSSFFPSIHAPQ